jgi:hypothetical protein
LKKLVNSDFFIRLTSWEYWPFGIVQLPFFIYWLWLSARARSLFFFSASNPGIVMGGMLGESKFDVLNLIPQHYKPKTVRVKYPSTSADVLRIFQENGYQFPVIFKPDLGERGFMVRRIFNQQDIDLYISTLKKDFLIQELLELPIECGVFYTRFPNMENGKVTSVVLKEMLTVTGDGKSTLEELILAKPRAKLQWEKLKAVHAENLQSIISKNKIVELNLIGNHCLGTKFLDGGYLINEKLSATFDSISKQIDGFYFGRFDLRCATIDDLYDGKIKVMELNGCGAEPAHIYQPGFSLWKALGVLFNHWSNMFIISVQNRKRGISYTSFSEGAATYRKFKAAIP